MTTAAQLITEKAYCDKAGIIRWKSNDQVPPDEILRNAGLDSQSYKRCTEAREAEQAKFIEEYRRNYKGPSEEQLAEMRAEFGPGATVVDVIAGKSIKL